MARPDAPVSRRKKREEAAPRPKVNMRSIAIQLGVVALVVVLFLLANRNGGAPQLGPTANDTARARVEQWSLDALYPDGSEVTLCADNTDCGIAVLWPAVRAEATCTFRATLWLGAPDHPLWARGLSASLNATLLSGDLRANETGAPNVTSTARDQTLPWTEGAWWRGERATVDLAVADVPCDLWQASLRVLVTGRTWTGGGFDSAQSASVFLHTDVQAGPGGAAPAAP